VAVNTGGKLEQQIPRALYSLAIVGHELNPELKQFY